jgi:Lsr2
MMAQKVTVALEDDLDGGPADETVRFGFEGADYEIDLSAKNARAFRKKLAPFIEHARKAARSPARRSARPSAGRQRSGEVRAWGPRSRHRGQRPRPDPGQRLGAVPGRHAQGH